MEEKQLIQFLRKSPHPLASVLSSLKMSEDELKPFYEKGIVFDTVDGVALCADYKVFLGTISLRKDNFAYITPVGSDMSKKSDIRVSGRSLEGYIIGDKVYFQVDAWNNGTIVGLYKRVGEICDTAFKSPSGTFFLHTKVTLNTGIDVVVTNPSNAPISDGDLLKCKVLSSARDAITVVYEETLAKASDVGRDISTIIASNGAPLTFPTDVLAEARLIPQTLSEEQLQGRTDFRDKTIVTIDGEDALDFDDAVSVKKINHGWEIGVYIADVSYYVRPNTSLDEEAERRGTSIYVADRVVPMLPTELSNGICSLNPHVDRLVIAVTMDVDEVGNVYSSKIEPGVINSKGRLTYRQVNDLLEKNDRTPFTKDIADMLLLMHEATKKIRLLRTKNGALDLDSTELKFRLDEKGNPVEVIKRTQGEGENMIEDLMIIANVAVATYLDTHGIPTLYRVHDNPPSDKMEQFRQFLKNIHLSKDFPAKVTPYTLSHWYTNIKDPLVHKTVGYFLLRSLAKAKYSPDNSGHFGLAENDYLHFTSPIRRYPDLIVHRTLHEYVFDKKPFDKDALYNSLVTLGMETSNCERRAVTIEREVDDYESCRYMKQHIGEAYDGVVSGMNAKGLFAELENGIEVFVAMRDINPAIRWEYNDEHFDIQSAERDEFTDRFEFIRLGDKIRVYISAVNMDMSTVSAMKEEAYLYQQSAEAYRKSNDEDTAERRDAPDYSRIRRSHSQNRKERRSFDQKGTYGHHDHEEKRNFSPNARRKSFRDVPSNSEKKDDSYHRHDFRAKREEAEENRSLTRFVSGHDSLDQAEAKRKFNSSRPSYRRPYQDRPENGEKRPYRKNSERRPFREGNEERRPLQGRNGKERSFDKKANYSDKEYSASKRRPSFRKENRVGNSAPSKRRNPGKDR